jgi:2,3,4,5-tetrahydropyridine-2,6-dicarboxylate N-succinyltransferase
MQAIQTFMESMFEQKPNIAPHDFENIFLHFIELLNKGTVRAAEPDGPIWRVNSWVKKGILLGFRYGTLQEFSLETGFSFFDKHTYPLKPLTLADKVRIVPGGSSARSGSYLAPGVVIMPPAYINVGAYVDSDSMIDSHALVGSCAQVGRHVHVSAAAQIGGVLEPIGAQPVIVEDGVLIGGNCGVYEGTRICKGAVLGAGTILTRSIPVYDLVNEKILRGSLQEPLTIPENAVVVAGSRPIQSNRFAQEEHLHLQCAIIVKYRDANTDRATALESTLR